MLTNKNLYFSGVGIGLITISLWTFIIFSNFDDFVKFIIGLLIALLLIIISLLIIGRRPMLKTISIEKQLSSIFKFRKRSHLFYLGVFTPVALVLITLFIK